MKKYIAAISMLVIVCSCNKDDDNRDINNVDRDFVMRASMANTAEISAGRLAAAHGSTAVVRSFGQMMVDDHSRAEEQLKALAVNYGLYAPDSVDAEHMAEKDRLMLLSGEAFDSTYINAQVKDHRTTIELFATEISYGNNWDIRGYANTAMPMLNKHLRMADSIAATFR